MREAIGQFIVDLQHVGSTSIPGMDAKPIIDIGAALARVRRRREVRRATGEESDTHIGDCQPGCIGIGTLSESTQQPTPSTFWSLRMMSGANLVLFRDYMIAHPDVAEDYAALKRSLGVQFKEDVQRYRDGKDPFIETVLGLARAEFGYRRT